MRGSCCTATTRTASMMIMTASGCVLNDEGQTRQQRRSNERLHIHRPRLTAYLRKLTRIGNYLRSCIHVALTARRELHSGSVACLEIPQSRGEQGNKERQAPRLGRVPQEQGERKRDTDHQPRESKDAPLAALARTEVRDSHASKCSKSASALGSREPQLGPRDLSGFDDSANLALARGERRAAGFDLEKNHPPQLAVGEPVEHDE